MNNCLLCNEGHVDFELKVKESNLVLSVLLKLYGKLSKSHGLHYLFQSAKICSKCITLLVQINEYFEEIEAIRGQIERSKETLQNNLIDCRNKHSDTEDDYDLRNILYDVISEEQNSSSILGNLNRVEENEDSMSNCDQDQDDSMIQSDGEPEHDVIVLDSDADDRGTGTHDDIVKEEIFVNNYVDCSIDDPNVTTTSQNSTTNESMIDGGVRKRRTQCPLCPQQIHPVNLNRHIRTVHRKIIPIKSRNKSSKPYTYNTHNKTSNVIQKQKYLCTKCTPNKPYTTFALYNAHINAVHMGIRFNCSFSNCDKIYRYEWELKKHFRDCHQQQSIEGGGTSTSSKTMPISFLKVLNPNLKRKYCSVCSNNFSSARGLTRHIKSMHGETRKKYICLVCNPEPNNLTSTTNGYCSSYSNVKRHLVHVHKMKDIEDINHLFNIIHFPQRQIEIEGAESQAQETMGDGNGEVRRKKKQCPLCPLQLHPLSLNRHIRCVHRKTIINQDQSQISQNEDNASISESTTTMNAESLSFMVTIEPTTTVILDSLNQIKNELFFDESAEDHLIEDNTSKPIEDEEQDPFENF